MPMASVLLGMSAVLAVTTGATVRICTGLPLLTPSTVTLACTAVPPVKLLSPLTVKSMVVALA